MTGPAYRSRLRGVDAVALGSLGLRARPVRSLLAALGIAVAVAALVAVLGIAASSQATLLAQLGREGNLLTVASGQTFSGRATPLPDTAERMIGAIPPVQTVTAVGQVAGATVRRSAAVPAIETGGISVLAAQRSLVSTVGATVLRGHFLDAVADSYPELVLGYSAARTLGISRLDVPVQVYVDGQYFAVVGILAPVEVAPELDDAALVSFPVAQRDLGLPAVDGTTRVYLRADPDQVAAVVAVLPFTASPAQPEAVEVRRPSDVLVARIAARTTFVGLFLGLTGVALLIGGIGVANIMVIAVLERRVEIGVRRALGARSRHIGTQFLVESVALAFIGGLCGAALGWLATLVWARLAGQPATVPLVDLAIGAGVAVLIGALAGLYPALRAARLAPARALHAL
jgi:putative ABC transport system permease protein